MVRDQQKCSHTERKKKLKINKKVLERDSPSQLFEKHGFPTIIVQYFKIVPENDRYDRKISYYDRRQPVEKGESFFSSFQ